MFSDLGDWKREALRALSLPCRPELMESALRRKTDRRDFFRQTGGVLAAGMLGLSGLGRAFGQAAKDDDADVVKTGTFFFPRLKFTVDDNTPDQWNVYPLADKILRLHLLKLTNINASQKEVIVSLSDLEAMSRYPYVFATSEGYFHITPQEEENLREFLSRGGFIHADDCVVGSGQHRAFPSDLVEGIYKPRAANRQIDGDRFFYDYLKLMDKLFPENPLKRVPFDHEIYHCYFDFKDGCPHMQGVVHGGWGLFEKGTGRIMSYATSGDIHCGWTCQWFDETKNMESIKMGINIIIYYLTH